MTPLVTPRPQTLVIWHGYLLGATGSNIYTRELVDSWVRAGHDVVLACQESDPDAHPRIHEVVELERDPGTGKVRARERRVIREPEPGHGRCTMVRPDVHGLLPVYVLDEYAGYEVVRVPGMAPDRLTDYLDDHAAAMRWVLAAFEPDGVLVNHASPLPAAIAGPLEEAGVPFVVKVHGSELEYALAEDDTLVPAAADALRRAAAVLVGSTHIAERTAQLLGPASLEGRTHVVPPGVDLQRFRAIGDDDASRYEAKARLLAEVAECAKVQRRGRTEDQVRAVRDLVAGIDGDRARAGALVAELGELASEYEPRHVEATAPAVVAGLDVHDRLLVFVGKLIPQKGVHLLLAALPDVLDRHPDARLVVAGFGPLRDVLDALVHAMDRGDLAVLDALVASGGSLSGEGTAELPLLGEWLAALRADGQLEAWLARARAARLPERVNWLGLVDHAVLAEFWPLAEASVVPSVLAEAFGMVAAEAATCGCVPVVADHSGLADAADVIERDGVAPVRFRTDDPAVPAVRDLADALVARLDLPADERRRQARAARINVAATWGWDELAASVAKLMTLHDA